jgi:hypothetical protein
MIAPCSSKTAFLPADQRMRPEKAVFEFVKEVLHQKLQSLEFLNLANQARNLIPKVSNRKDFGVILDSAQSAFASFFKFHSERRTTCRVNSYT